MTTTKRIRIPVIMCSDGVWHSIEAGSGILGYDAYPQESVEHALIVAREQSRDGLAHVVWVECDVPVPELCTVVGEVDK